MTTAFEQLLYVYGDAICGRQTNLSQNCDRDAIAEKAIEHNVLPIVYGNLFGDEVDNKYYKIVMCALASNERKMYFLKKMIAELEEEGIICCVLKGNSLSRLYAEPGLRISGDIDLLISPHDERCMIQFLKKRNFIIKKRPIGHQHFVAVHKMAGIYEIHIKLFDKEFNKHLLRGKFKTNEPFQKVVTFDETTMNILGKNDGLYFVTAHMIKHFLKDGLGLRQISDWLLYVQKYKDELNMKTYERVIKELGFDRFINAMYTIGKKYFGMSLADFEEIPPEDILSDMDEGGSFGHGDYDRMRYKPKLLDAVYDRTQGEKKANRIKILFYAAFPSKKALVKRGFVKENSNSILIPLAWIKRWFDILLSGKLSNAYMYTGGKGINEEKLEKRLNMLRNYKFIKSKEERMKNES